MKWIFILCLLLTGCSVVEKEMVTVNLYVATYCGSSGLWFKADNSIMFNASQILYVKTDTTTAQSDSYTFKSAQITFEKGTYPTAHSYVTFYNSSGMAVDTVSVDFVGLNLFGRTSYTNYHISMNTSVYK